MLIFVGALICVSGILIIVKKYKFITDQKAKEKKDAEEDMGAGLGINLFITDILGEEKAEGRKLSWGDDDY